MERKNLPLGIQDFELLIEHNYIYVDKTELLYSLIKNPAGYYFLSRPRRFGKSLLISTLDCFFRGKKDLFKGLWVYENSVQSWEKHPVIKIDFNKINHRTAEILEKSILAQLQSIASEYELSIDQLFIPNFFAALITQLEKRYKRNVVVLIDEYDKPIISHLGKGDEELSIAGNNRDVLKQLYGVLKAQDVSGALRFVFLTGVSKFSQVSVFSDLNNLEDLTMREDYCDIAGYTEKELYFYFEEYIEEISGKFLLSVNECKQKIRAWYNGYQFTARELKMYNPFSILSLFKAKQFRNYWFETGTPTFLVNLIKERDYNVPAIEKLELRENAFTKYDIETLALEALLFQTGYITIQRVKGRLYALNYPNQEVKNSFIDYLYEHLLSIPDNTIKNKFTLLADYLNESKYDSFISLVNIILSSIPYTQLAGKDESYYHTIFYLMLSASGVEVLTEVLTSRGRIDIAVFYSDKTYIIELKCNQDAAMALQQIKDKGYADKYNTNEKSVLLMGINFDTTQRKISGWKVEKI